MTREERIKSALLPILEKMREHGATDEMCKMYDNGFHIGAMWADRSMVDKACEWLVSETTGDLYEDDLINDFRKAMKGD